MILEQNQFIGFVLVPLMVLVSIIFAYQAYARSMVSVKRMAFVSPRLMSFLLSTDPKIMFVVAPYDPLKVIAQDDYDNLVTVRFTTGAEMRFHRSWLLSYAQLPLWVR